MTQQQDNSHRDSARARITDQWRPQWLIPLVPAALGAVILVAAALGGHLLSGVVWAAVLAAIGVLSWVGGRLDAVRCGQRPDEGEREATINTCAMSIAGTVLIIALTGCAVFTLVRGESTAPYTALLAVGGASYAVASLALRHRHT